MKKNHTVKTQRTNVPPSSSAISFDVIALAASAGGLTALSTVLSALPADFPAALLVVQHLEIDVTPLQENDGGFIGASITFLDVTKFHQLQKDLLRSKQEVETAYEELQSSNEELETTNEELQSTVEELETTNEELQSGNEEMETMNEELQSTNEELQTLNDELRTRTEELNTTNGFLQSILRSVLAGVVVLDHKLNILIWNQAATDLWGLRAEEVHGQAFFNLDIGLPVGRLRVLMRDILAEKTERQVLVLDATNRRGKAICCLVTCTPLLNAERKSRVSSFSWKIWRS